MGYSETTERGSSRDVPEVTTCDRQMSLPAAYHTNCGNNGAGWLVKSERGLADLYHDSPADPPGQHPGASVDHLVKRDFLSNFSEFARIQISGQPRPGLLAELDRAHDGIDAEKTHAAQNEGRNRRWQVHAPGQATSGDGAAILGRGQQIRQGGRTDA